MEKTEKLSRNIAIIRIWRGFSQENMAEMLQISRKTYIQVEAGNRRPDYHEFHEIANILNVSPLSLENFDIDFHIELQTIISTYYSSAIPKKKLLEIFRSKLEKRFSEL